MERTREGIPASRLLGLVFLAAALPYLASLHFPLAYDDHGQLLENPFIRNPARFADLLGLRTLGDAAVINGRRPLVLLTYMTDLHLLGGSVIAFRSTSLLLHLGVMGALLGLFRKLGGTRPDLLAAAGIFGMHPLLVEAVHMPSFRPDILCTLFMLLGLRLCLDLVEKYSWPWLLRIACIAACFLLALLSKESAIIFPLLAAGAWWFFPSARPRRGTMLCIAGSCLGLFGLYALACAGGAPLQAAGSSWNGISLPWPANLLTAPWLLAKYLALLLVPSGYSLDHAILPVTQASDLRLYAGIACAAAAAAASLLLRKKFPAAAFGIFVLLAAYLPVSNLIPLINPFAERYAYPMTAGFAMTAAGLAAQAHRAVLARVVPALCAILLVASLVRIFDWSSERRLWSSTLEENPESVKALTWLGVLDMHTDPDTARARFQRAADLNPSAASDAMVNLAILEGQQGQLDRAEEILREAVRLRPEKPAPYRNLGFDLELQGRRPEALDVLREGMKVDPHYLPTRLLLADLLATEGQVDEALSVTRTTLQLDPDQPDAAELFYLLTERPPP